MFKVQLFQQFLPTDCEERKDCINWIIEKQEVNADFTDTLIFNGESNFDPDDFLYRQNCCIFVSECDNVCCLLCSGEITGLLFFE